MSRVIGHGTRAADVTVGGFTGQKTTRVSDPQPALAAPSEAGEQSAPNLRWVDDSANRIALLEREVAALTAELEAHATRQEQVQQQAFDRGYAEGSQQTREDAEQRNEALRAGIAQAAERFAKAHSQIEPLALQLASVAVARLLGDATGIEDQLRQVIAICLQRFAAQRPHAVRLSRKDFPDPEAIAPFVAQWPEMRIEADPALGAGECRLQLELGEVDIGLPGQLERLRQFFDEAAQDAIHAPSAEARV